VHTLRLVGSGLSDTLEQLLPFTVLTLCWWLSVPLIVPAPAATVTLFAMTDPRHIVARPDWREVLALARSSFRRGWLIALIISPPVVILVRNLTYYGVSGSAFSTLAYFWLVLILVFGTVGVWAFSAAGLQDASGRDALRAGARLVATQPMRALTISIVCWLLLALSTLLVVPLVMFAPAMIAAIVNRCVLEGLGIQVDDPLEPTAERRREERTPRSRRGRG